VSVPRPRPPARAGYLRKLHDRRLQLQIGEARQMLHAKRWQLRLFIGGAALALAALGGGLALLVDHLVGR
jgi:hypothetical protein